GGLVSTLGHILPADAGWVASAPGVGAIGGVDGFSHFELATPDHLEIRHESVEGSNDFDEVVGVDGFSLRFPTDRFRVQVKDAANRVLAGSYRVGWVSTNPVVLTVEAADTHASIAHFELHSSGMASLEIVAGELSTDVSFQVN
ncbi:MAG TPA: hypothetical protein VL400_25625, partial [Polyangiaceae bacterium]|nr:hypothetical protein [Polyangiaceae bacterium]